MRALRVVAAKDSAASPTPAELDRLAAERRAGVTWDRAWPAAVATALSAVRGVERTEWATVFTATAESWRQAFQRQEPRPSELALTVALEDRNPGGATAGPRVRALWGRRAARAWPSSAGALLLGPVQA